MKNFYKSNGQYVEDDVVQQIRADAIDEIEDAIINSFEDCSEVWTIISVLHHIHEVLEQLKEQK